MEERGIVREGFADLVVPELHLERLVIVMSICSLPSTMLGPFSSNPHDNMTRWIVLFYRRRKPQGD